MLDLELVDAARAAAGVEVADLDRRCRIGDIPEHQAVVGVRVVARVAAALDAGRGDVTAFERPVARGVDDDILGRGVRRVLEPRHHRGLAGSRASITTTLVFESAGQKRSFDPCAQSPNPHWPT